MSFLVEIISPEGKVFSGEVEKISVPSLSGQLTILSHHLPLFTPLVSGKIRVVNLQGNERFFPLSKGLMEVKKDKVALLIESPEQAQAAVQKRAQEGEKQVEKIKIQKPKQELLTPKQAVRRSLVDLKKIKRRRKSKFSIENQT
jgi:F-type H+-transporting ATPase subunit epsilon